MGILSHQGQTVTGFGLALAARLAVKQVIAVLESCPFTEVLNSGASWDRTS